MKRICFIALLSLACCFNSIAQDNTPTLRADNIDEILNAMTTEEKVSLLVGVYVPELVTGAAGYTCEISRLGIPTTVLADGPWRVRDPDNEGQRLRVGLLQRRALGLDDGRRQLPSDVWGFGGGYSRYGFLQTQSAILACKNDVVNKI